MKNLPNLVAMDLETGLISGKASTDYYRDDFRVLSCAISWQEGHDIKNFSITGENNVHELLRTLADNSVPLVCHNIAYEMGVCKARFPELRPIWHADTMRLVQLADNGGTVQEADEESDSRPIEKVGLGLEVCVSRWLPLKYHNHKAPYHQILRDVHGVRKGQEGGNLHLLSETELEQYNVADTDVTLRLFHRLTEFFAQNEFNWKPDHELYLFMADKIAETKLKGVLVDQENAKNAVIAIDHELKQMSVQFKELLWPHITAIEEENLCKLWDARKTEKAKHDIWLRATESPELYEFNINSTSHKQRLFVDKLNIVPTFYTDKGRPSFARHLLGQWGEGGKILGKRGTLAIARSQAETILTMSEHDKRCHIDLRAAGTTTGRFAGSGGLNIQGMSRKEPRLMRSLVADPGHVFVSVDLAAGEPTITTHFSQDPYYKSATFDMVGKTPYYDRNGVLMIDDIYLMGMSVSPMGQEIMWNLYDKTYEGGSFGEQWVKNPDVIKDLIKKERAFHKILILGLGYSMGPKHMVESAFKAGHELSFSKAKAFFNAYWKLFSGVRNLADNLESQFNQQGYLQNPFGYRLVPNPSYKSLNYFIQSSVSGLINVLCMKFFTVCPEARFITVIHDEIIFQIPEHYLDEAKVLFDYSVESLNEDLGWSVKVRCGWKPGRDFYEAK